MIPNWLSPCTILQGPIGSEALGLSLAGSSDRDEQGVCIEPIEEALRLGQPFEQVIHRDAHDRTGKHDQPSEPGDLDLKVYSLRKFCRLAADGNPDVLMMLFLPRYTQLTAPGEELQSMASLFVSREAGARYLGYMQGQKLRLLGLRGQKRVKRPELETEHGYDTKYAMHLLRLGYQGIELLETGVLRMPMNEQITESLLDLRRGKWLFEHVIGAAEELERRLKDLIPKSPLPEHPNRAIIENWMQRVYLEWWAGAGLRNFNATRGMQGAKE